MQVTATLSNGSYRHVELNEKCWLVDSINYAEVWGQVEKSIPEGVRVVSVTIFRNEINNVNQDRGRD